MAIRNPAVKTRGDFWGRISGEKIHYKTDIVFYSKSSFSVAIFHHSKFMYFSKISSHLVQIKQTLYRPGQAMRFLGD
jgi:hypothetical protein